MCNVCNVSMYTEKRIRSGEYNDLYIVREFDDYYLRAEGDGCVWFQLNYCPECGRVLMKND